MSKAELSKTIFDNAKEKVKNLKEYYENTKLIAEQLERAATAMEKISKYQDLAINIKNNGNTNNTGSQNNANNITNTTNANNSAQPVAINNQSSEPDYSLIANAIKEGFGDINKLTVVLDSGDELDLSLAFGK